MSKDKETTPLSVMLASGGDFEVQGKNYTVKPIALKDAESFMKDNLSLGTQIFNITDKKTRDKVDRWLKGYCFDEEGTAITLKKAMELEWDVVDLKEFFRKLCDFSG